MNTDSSLRLEQEPNAINKRVGLGGRGEERLGKNPASSLVHLMEHQFTGDGCFWTKLGSCPTLEGSDILLDNLIKKHGGQLGVQQRTKFKGNLGIGKRQKSFRTMLDSPWPNTRILFSVFPPAPPRSLDPLKSPYLGLSTEYKFDVSSDLWQLTGNAKCKLYLITS